MFSYNQRYTSRNAKNSIERLRERLKKYIYGAIKVCFALGV